MGAVFKKMNNFKKCVVTPTFYVIYCTLNSLSLFWLVKSVQWIFEISACDTISADYTIIMSRTLKVTGCLPSVMKQKHDFHFFHSMYNKTIILSDSVFVISRIIKVSVRVISLSLWLQLITPTSTLIILDITKTSSNNILEMEVASPFNTWLDFSCEEKLFRLYLSWTRGRLSETLKALLQGVCY